jgi:hypothetical protein
VPLCDADAYAEPDNPQYSDVVAESDYVAYKPSTDVVVLGKARAPSGKQAYHLDCSVSVGPLGKTVRVFGRRAVGSKAFRGVSIGDPEPFEEAPLGYAHAYGGVARTKEGTLFPFMPNPIGKGFCLKEGVEDPAGIALPSLEDPESPLTPDNLLLSRLDQWVSAPRPVSLGWTRRSFYPRYTYAGVLPEYLEGALQAAERLGENATVPRMDLRFYQGASDGLFGSSLSGGETVRLAYLDREHPTFEFPLPNERPLMTVNVGDGAAELETALHTVVIDKERNVLTMLWRGAFGIGTVGLADILPRFRYNIVPL